MHAMYHLREMDKKLELEEERGPSVTECNLTKRKLLREGKKGSEGGESSIWKSNWPEKQRDADDDESQDPEKVTFIPNQISYLSRYMTFY